MTTSPAIFDTGLSKELSVDGLLAIYRHLGVQRVIFKQLSPNDNSKNQPYMGGHLTDLGFLPTNEIHESQSASKKTTDPKRQVKYTAPLNYSWMSAKGELFRAPDAKLIYYPQYPEVRFSGFLQGCKIDMGGWMDPVKKGRSEGRVLFFGITEPGEIYAYLATPESRITKEIEKFSSVELSGVFRELNITGASKPGSSKDLLIAELYRIHKLGCIPGKILKKNGVEEPYKAMNGGGYTLEAELGVKPNGKAEPDYLGWEIKQFGVTKFHLINSKPLTLMTPEPDGGFYKEKGMHEFMLKYGYPDTKGRVGRYNFNGKHITGVSCMKTDLTLKLHGFDPGEGQISNAAGCIALIDDKGEIASSWSFSKVMKHWMRKHAKAAYIPSMAGKSITDFRCYHYGSNIRLFKGTSFNQLLKAMADGHVYYDPGNKLEGVVDDDISSATSHRRNQFRIKSGLLDNLYASREDVDVLLE